MRSKRIKKIIPQVEKCVVCKKGKVISHHVVCDKCCSERDKKIHREKMKKLMKRKKKKREVKNGI